MNKRLRVACALLYVFAAGILLFGIVYLLSPTIFPYHERFLGMSHADLVLLNSKAASLFVALMKVIGGLELSLGFGLAILIWGRFSKGDNWIWWTILVMSAVGLIPILFVTLKMGLYTPWWGVAVMMILVAVALILSKPAMEKEDKTRLRWSDDEVLYGVFCVLYGALVVLLVYWFREKKYLGAGLIIGGIYVAVAMYYFYEQFLVPYLKEKIAREEAKSAGEKPKSTGDEDGEIGVYSPNIFAWLIQWMFPAFFLQIFVIFGFWIAIQGFPFQGNVFSGPYEYGLVYKRFDALVADTFPKAKEGVSAFDAREAEDRAKNLETFLTKRFSGYLDPEKIERTKSGSEKGGLGAVVKAEKESLEEVPFRDLEGKIYKIPFMIAFAFGFLGSLIYTLKDTAHRFYTLDMYPKTYVGYIIRFFFAPSLCLVVAYFLSNDWIVSAGPILFFMIGFFPQTAFRYIEEKGLELLKIRKEKKEGMPLDSIQGMTDYIMYRFKELGVDDVQNLANVDLPYLRRNMGYSNRLLADFIGQALLRLYFVDDFNNLRAAGIRDVLSFQANVNEGNCQTISEVVKITKEKLQGFLVLLKSESMKERVETLKQLKCETDKRESEQMQAELKCR